MKLYNDTAGIYLLVGMICLLSLATVLSLVFLPIVKSESGKRTIENIWQRVKSWWVMFLIFAMTSFIGEIGSVILFGLISFFALREFITITRTHRTDHRALFWAFFIILPFQYYLIGIKWYGLFAIFIPVYAFLFIPIRMMIVGDYKNFFVRTSQIQWSLMVTVYFVSYAPALLTLNIPGYSGPNIKLLFFLMLVVQLCDVFQYLWGKALGKHKLSPNISPNKTVEGFIGGVISSTALGASLWWVTPFSPLEAGLIALTISLLGVAGDLTLSAIKRDNGIKDYGNMIKGHGGIMDRIDSLCFAAPVFFHIIRYFYTP